MKDGIVIDLSDSAKEDQDEIETGERVKKFKWFRAIFTTIIVLVIIIFVTYSITIISSKDSSDKNNKYYKNCLENINLSSATWATYGTYISKEFPVSKDKLWNKLIKLDDWKNWDKNYFKNVEILYGDKVQDGTEIKLSLDFGLPFGSKTFKLEFKNVLQNESLILSGENDNIRMCSAWSFVSVDENKTVITYLQIFHGNTIAMYKPFITKSWQKTADETVKNFVDSI